MYKILIFIFIIVALIFGYYQVKQMDAREMTSPTEDLQNARTAVFAGGCFWCTESDFEKVPGVIDAVSGYTGGHVINPTYEEVSAGGTGHVESVMVYYDPEKVSYEQLLNYFWRHVDPTDADGQFVDRGSQYRSVIFYANQHQKDLAEASKKQLEESGKFDKPIVTEILPLGPFYPAEQYHQNYYKKNPVRYKFYRWNSGRDQFLEKVWGKDESSLAPITGKDSAMETNMNETQKMGMNDPMPMQQGDDKMYKIPDKETLRKELTPMEYKVTQENGTEPAFENKYWNNHEAGIYVDIVSGEPLFSSTDKFDSGTGWPSFTQPIDPDDIIEKTDRSFFMTRTEVRSKHADSHLGHVFDDGPPPTGLRYCINSAALKFIPKADLEKDGYGKYLKLFDKNK